MVDWRQTRHGAKLLAIKLSRNFAPSVVMHVAPRPECPLCVIDGTASDTLTALHSDRFGGDSFPILLSRYVGRLGEEGIEMNANMLATHFSEHFVMRSC